jgi:hypothetical protein
MSYDNANSTVRREVQVNNLLGIASTMMARILFFQKTRVKKVHALVITAGTNDAAGVDLLNGTASVGAIVFGTATAGTLANSGTLDADIAANSYLEIKGKATSATMVDSYSIECQVLPEAAQTA